MLSLTLRGNKTLCNGRQLLFFYQHSQPILRYKIILFYLLFLISILLFKKKSLFQVYRSYGRFVFFSNFKVEVKIFFKIWQSVEKGYKVNQTYHCAEAGSNPATYGPNQLINHFQIKGLSAFLLICPLF